MARLVMAGTLCPRPVLVSPCSLLAQQVQYQPHAHHHRCARGFAPLHQATSPTASAFSSAGIDYFQIISIFATISIKWPAQLTQLLTILSAFNFVRSLRAAALQGTPPHSPPAPPRLLTPPSQNLDLTAPECAFKVSYTSKWVFIELAPVGASRRRQGA